MKLYRAGSREVHEERRREVHRLVLLILLGLFVLALVYLIVPLGPGRAV